MKIDIKRNAKRNITIGLINKIILLILPFVSRMVIKQQLGAQYLGLNSLFSSILSVLSLSELGLSSALVYHMYKPIAEDDHEKLSALLNLYRKAYLLIGTVISVIGLVLVPFLPKFISGSYPDNINIYLVYLVQLFNCSISYFLFGYKQSLLVAHQRNDIDSLINLLTQFGLQVAQIILLVTTRNYYYFIFCMPVFTIINNLWVAYFTNRLYPDLNCQGKLDRDTLKNIKKLVIGSFVQKACGTTRNSLDSICISAFVGLAITGMYNNYYTIFNGVTALLAILSVSITGGIGNHVVIKSKDENFNELQLLDFLYMALSGWCVTCLLCMSQSFMKFWMGDEMLLPIITVINMCVYFYAMKLGDMRCNYYNATGLWWEMRWRSIGETISNLVLNICLGYFFGINGIVLATTISIFLFNFIWGASIIFRCYFGKEKLHSYYLYQLHYFINTVLVCGITYIACSRISFSSPLVDLVVKGIICCVVGGGMTLLLNCKNELFKPAMKMILKRS